MSGRLERKKLEYQRELYKMNNLLYIGVAAILVPLFSILNTNYTSSYVNINIVWVIVVLVLGIRQYYKINNNLTELANKLECEK